MAARLYVSEHLDKTLLRLTTAAVATTPGCEFASITVAHDGSFQTHGETDPRARQIDEIQYQTGQGPCLDAATTAALVYTSNTAHDLRWPEFCSRAGAEAGVGSLLSYRLSLAAATEPALGALNLYALQPERLPPTRSNCGTRSSARDVFGQAIGVEASRLPGGCPQAEKSVCLGSFDWTALRVSRS